MNDRITELEGALRAQAALIRGAQEELTNYLSAKIDAMEYTDRMIRLFDGPGQRKAQRQARKALGDQEPDDIAS